MAGLILLVLLALVAGVAVLVALTVASVRSRPDATPPAVATAARRHEALVSLGAAVTSLAVVLLLAGNTGVVWTSDFEPLPVAPGFLAFTSPFLGAIVFCLARAAGEQLWPRPRGTVRSAPLVRRTVRDLGGRRLDALLATTALGLVVLVVYGLTAEPDGRGVAAPPTLDAQGAVIGTGSAGPYPGWPFGVPIGLALLLALGAALLALRAVTRRPPLALVPREHDDAVRRTSAARVLAGAQAWVGSALGLMMLMAAVPLHNTEHGGAALASALAGLTVGAASVALAASAVIGRRVRETGPATGDARAVPA